MFDWRRFGLSIRETVFIFRKRLGFVLPHFSMVFHLSISGDIQNKNGHDMVGDTTRSKTRLVGSGRS